MPPHMHPTVRPMVRIKETGYQLLVSGGSRGVFGVSRPLQKYTVQLNLNFTHACKYMHARTHFTCIKVYNVECIFFVARGFVMCTRAIKQL